MAPAASPSERERERVGPHPSYIEVAKPYMMQSRIHRCLLDLHMSDAKEDLVRLQGVAWIDQVRRALQLPIRTFNTAVVYYHKFRLLHADHEYSWADAAAAALFTACKIEDTLKKSREILCAHWNAKVGQGESLSSDDPVCFLTMPLQFSRREMKRLTERIAIRIPLQAHHRPRTAHARERRL